MTGRDWKVIFHKDLLLPPRACWERGVVSGGLERAGSPEPARRLARPARRLARPARPPRLRGSLARGHGVGCSADINISLDAFVEAISVITGPN